MIVHWVMLLVTLIQRMSSNQIPGYFNIGEYTTIYYPVLWGLYEAIIRIPMNKQYNEMSQGF